jgi:outer membrane usher protein
VLSLRQIAAAEPIRMRPKAGRRAQWSRNVLLALGSSGLLVALGHPASAFAQGGPRASWDVIEARPSWTTNGSGGAVASTRSAQTHQNRSRASTGTPSRRSASKATAARTSATRAAAPRPAPPEERAKTPALVAAPQPVQMAQVVGPQVPTAPAPAPAAARPAASAVAANPATPRLNPTGRTINIVVPIVDNQLAIGEVTLTLGSDDSLRVGAEPLLAALTPILDPRALERLRGQVAGRRDLSSAEWAEFGYSFVYDPARIELKISIPVADRLSKRLEVASLEDVSLGNFEAPAKTSGYLNVRGSVDYIHQGIETGLDDPNFVLDGALRFGRIVFETEANYGPGSDNDMQFQREGSRFVFDDVARTMRWALGDVQGQTAGFSSTGQVLGLSVFRTYSELAPQRFARPRGEREFVLNRSSNVEAIVNGRSVRKIRLDAGTYKLNDFPFIEGSNDVRLIIEDDTGVREALNFNLFFDRTLLTPGLTEFSFTAGQTSILEDSGPNYDDGDWIIGGFVRRGINERLTLGANAQLQESGQLVGIESVFANTLGTFSLDAAASQNDGIGSGAALTLVYSRLIAINGGRSQSLGLTLEARSEDFSIPGARSSSNPYTAVVGASYSRSFGEFSFGGLDFRYSAGRGTVLDQSSFRATFGRRVGALGNLTIDADWRDNGLEQDFGVRLAFTMRFGTQSSLRSEYNSRDESVRLSYQRQRGEGVGSYNLSADLDRSSERVGANLAASYVANRADVSYALNTSYDTSNSRISDQRSSLRFGTSFAFADGAVAIGRPISDSFAIIGTHKSLGRSRVVLEPRPEGFSAQSGPLGGALFGNLAAYSERSIAVDVPNAPNGYDLGAGTFRVRPGYRSGYKFSVGSDYSVTVIGRLLDRDGVAISLLAGTASEVSNPNGPKLTVFTNRDGRFALSGARPGKWRIDMPTSPPIQYEVTIPESSEGIVRLGNVEAP